MLALCRLAKEQGILAGDLNEVQVLALISTMSQETERQTLRDWARFEMMAVAMHPERGTEIIEAFKGNSGDEEFAKPISDEELAYWRPLSDEEKEKMISDLRHLGFSSSE